MGKKKSRSGEDRADPSANAPAALPFRYRVRTATLAEAGGLAFDVAPDEIESAAIAAYLGIEGVSGYNMRGQLEPDGDGWRMTAILRAAPVQACVVTLEPVAGRIEVEIERRYQPDLRLPEEVELELGAEDDRAPEPLGDEIDLAQPMIEDLALALDPFPRRDGAAHGAAVYAPPGVDPLTDEAARPFAGLAALKARLGDGSEDGGEREG
ncbi:MAG: DUF177 domain-containing protein [Pseudomonadota bacterium]